MKPKHIKEQREKEVRKIQKRINEIYRERRKLGYIKLDKPIRHGWFKEIVIISKIERYRNKEHILELYKIIEKVFWGRTKEEAEKHWLNQTSKFLIYKDFPTISKKQFNKLSYKAQKLCTPFQYRNERKKLKIRYYIRIPKNAYQIKYTRAYITHSRKIDPCLESELDYLYQKLLSNEYYKLNRYPWKDDWQTPEFKKEKFKVKKELNALKKHPVEDAVNNLI